MRLTPFPHPQPHPQPHPPSTGKAQLKCLGKRRQTFKKNSDYTLKKVCHLMSCSQNNKNQPMFPKNISMKGCGKKRHPFNKTFSTNIIHKLQCIIITFFPSLILEPDYKVRKNTETRYNVLNNRHKGKSREIIFYII